MASELTGEASMNSSSSSASASVPQARRDVVTFSHLISIKLDENNYLLWKHQVYTAIRGHDLHNFINPFAKPPEMFLTDKDSAEGFKANPEFLDWQKQDHLLMSWLSCLMSEGVLTRIVGCIARHLLRFGPELSFILLLKPELGFVN